MCEAWLADISLAVCMAAHSRLGHDSGLATIAGPTEILQIVLGDVRSSTGVRSWKWLDGEDEDSLVGFTTLRHARLGTTVQLSHASSTSIRFREAGQSRVLMVCEGGETFPSALRSPDSIECLDSGGGVLVPERGLRRNHWTVSYRGPDLHIKHCMAPDMALLLTGDSFTLLPASAAISIFMGLPPPPAIVVCERNPLRELARQDVRDTLGAVVDEVVAESHDWMLGGVLCGTAEIEGADLAGAGTGTRPAHL